MIPPTFPARTSLPDREPVAGAPRPPAWEWAPVAAWPALYALSMSVLRLPETVAGPLWVCLAAGLAPGVARRLAGKRAGGWYRAGLAAALLAYMAAKHQAGLAGRLPGLAEAWGQVAAAVGLVALQPFLGAWRWRILLAATGFPLRYRDLLRLTLAGNFFNLAVPGSTGGDLARVGLLARARRGQASRWETAAASVALDRMLGLPALFALLGAAYAANAGWAGRTPPWRLLAPWVALAGIIAWALVAAMAWGARPLGGWLAARAAEAGKTAAAAGRLAGVVEAFGGRGKAMLAAVGVGTLGHAANAAACMALAGAVGVRDIPRTAFLLLSPGALAVNALPFSPGGAGQGELAFGHLLESAAPGLGNGGAGALMMLCLRLGTLLTGLAGGLLWMAGKVRADAGDREGGAA